MARAKEFGVLPEQSRDLLDELKNDLKDGLDDLRRLTLRNNIGWLRRGADATQKLRYGVPDPTRRFIPRFDAKNPDCKAAYDRWGDGVWWLRWTGRLLCAVYSCRDQWSRDTGRPDIGMAEGFARSIYRGGVVVTGVWAVGGAGVFLGGIIGSLIAAGPGAVVGGIVGGIIGGIVGASIANWFVDRTVDWVGNLVKPVDHAIDAVINAVKSAGFKIAEMFLNVRHRFA